jgi:hypothetical protein
MLGRTFSDQERFAKKVDADPDLDLATFSTGEGLKHDYGLNTEIMTVWNIRCSSTNMQLNLVGRSGGLVELNEVR